MQPRSHTLLPRHNKAAAVSSGQFTALEDDAQAGVTGLDRTHAIQRRHHFDVGDEGLDQTEVDFESEAVRRLLNSRADGGRDLLQVLRAVAAIDHVERLHRNEGSGDSRASITSGANATIFHGRSADILLGNRSHNGAFTLRSRNRRSRDFSFHLRHAEKHQRLDVDGEVEVIGAFHMENVDDVAGDDGALEQLVVEHVDDVGLDAAIELRHRTRGLEQPLASVGVDVDRDLAHLLRAGHQFGDLQFADFGNVLIGEPMEDAELTVLFHASAEFGRCEVTQVIVDDLVGFFHSDDGLLATIAETDAALFASFLHRRRTDVGSDDEEALAEVDHFSVTQSVAAGAEDAQQDFVELLAGLLPLVDQNHRNRSLGTQARTSEVVLAELSVAVDLIGQRSDVVPILAVGVTNEVGAGAGELAEVVLLHVLAAVDVEHRQAIAMEELAEAETEFGLAGGGGARGDDHVVRLGAGAQLGERTAESTASGLVGVGLTLDDLVDEAAEPQFGSVDNADVEGTRCGLDVVADGCAVRSHNICSLFWRGMNCRTG